MSTVFQKLIEQGKEIGVKEGEERGVKKGIEIGVKEGEEKGVKKERMKFAAACIIRDLDVDTIAELTGLPRKRIEQLRDSMKNLQAA